MVRRARWMLLFPLCVVGSAWADEVKVQPVSISESRQLKLKTEEKKDAGFSFSTNEPELTLQIELVGPAAGAATHWGKLKIKTARVDHGDALELRPAGYHDPSEDFVQIDRNMMFFGQDTPSADQLLLDLKFNCPPRAATKLSLLEGQLALRVGKRKTVLVDGLRAKEGQAVEDQILKAAGVSLRLTKPASEGFMAPDEPTKSITFKLAGVLDAVLEVDVVDAGGKSIKAGHMSSGSDTEMSYVVQSEDTLPADAKLKLTVITDRRDVEVPFRLENIPLP
jgi:hypothetical protein